MLRIASRHVLPLISNFRNEFEIGNTCARLCCVSTDEHKIDVIQCFATFFAPSDQNFYLQRLWKIFLYSINILLSFYFFVIQDVLTLPFSLFIFLYLCDKFYFGSYKLNLEIKFLKSLISFEEIWNLRRLNNLEKIRLTT